jgi:hypothetical protein
MTVIPFPRQARAIAAYAHQRIRLHQELGSVYIECLLPIDLGEAFPCASADEIRRGTAIAVKLFEADLAREAAP